MAAQTGRWKFVLQILHEVSQIFFVEIKRVFEAKCSHRPEAPKHKTFKTDWLLGSWLASQLPTMNAGKRTVLDAFDTPLPRQTDGVSCGVFVVVYMVMFSRNKRRRFFAESIHSSRLDIVIMLP